MALIYWILIFSLLGGVLSVLAASIFLVLPDDWRNRMLPHFVSFAIGALLGAAFLALLPHALSGPAGVDPHRLGMTILIGILLFFILEKLLLWRHCHADHCEGHQDHGKPALASMVIVGDGLHNFVDGILIASAFMTDIELGIVTSLAVAAHEIPQEIGDFALLLHGGMSRKRAFFYNIGSSLTTVVGAVLAWYSLSDLQHILPYVLVLAASSFIYIAVADLIPGLHQRTRLRETLKQLGFITVGIVVIYTAHATLHS